MPVRNTLRKHVLEQYLFSDDDTLLADNDSFLEKGILDSTGIMEIIFFIEETFGFSVADEEMVPENLDSINNLTAFIERKSGQ